MILGNYESSSSSQPVRTLISRFPFFGEFLPAGEIWTNTSQSTKSTLNKKKCGESVFLSNPDKYPKSFEMQRIFDAAYIYYEYSLSTSGNKVKDLLCAIICMHSFCPSLKYFPNVKIFLKGVEIWTNKSQQDRKRSQPPKRNFSVFFYFVDPENGRVWERRTFLDKFFVNLNMR